jgi:hypothetical protein
MHWTLGTAARRDKFSLLPSSIHARPSASNANRWAVSYKTSKVIETSAAEMMETAISTVSTAFAETQMAIPPTNTPRPVPTVSFLTTTPLPPPTFPTPTLLSSPTPLVFTDPSVPLSERIVFYYFVTPAENPIPEGTVRAGSLLAPTYSDETYTSDTSADLRTALEIVLHDGRNWWRGSDLEIVDVTFRNGHTDVVLQGEYFARGGGPLWAASWQLLRTVFANPSVKTATISINGGAIGNLGISNSRDA